MPEQLPAIAITSGEPAGIGPEVTLKALSIGTAARVAVLGDASWLDSLIKKLNLSLNVKVIQDISQAEPNDGTTVFVLHHPVVKTPRLGQLDADNSNYVLQLLDQAHQLAMTKKVDAIVTAPVHKGILNQGAQTFSGHTEYFAAAAGVEQVVMMLASEQMRMALVTTHLPLRDVPSAITPQRINRVLSVCHQGLQALGIEQPRIRVLGLNPHAGEQGHLGHEDDAIIAPCIQQFQQILPTVTGPYPADTAYSKEMLATTDLYLAMYHDQGLPVIKFASFGQCANVTLGLPYVRTSVDHGTALNIADQLIASESSMSYALQFAAHSATGHHHKAAK